MIDRFVANRSFGASCTAAIALLFLGFAVPMAALSAIGHKAGSGGDVGLWLLLACVVPTSLIGLVIVVKAASVR